MKEKQNMFSEWILSRHTIISPDAKHELWISNGFPCFCDYNSNFSDRENLLSGIGIVLRWKIWRQFVAEKRRRVRKLLK